MPTNWDEVSGLIAIVGHASAAATGTLKILKTVQKSSTVRHMRKGCKNMYYAAFILSDSKDTFTEQDTENIQDLIDRSKTLRDALRLLQKEADVLIFQIPEDESFWDVISKYQRLRNRMKLRTQSLNFYQSSRTFLGDAHTTSAEARMRLLANDISKEAQAAEETQMAELMAEASSTLERLLETEDEDEDDDADTASTADTALDPPDVADGPTQSSSNSVWTAFGNRSLESLLRQQTQVWGEGSGTDGHANDATTDHTTEGPINADRTVIEEHSTKPNDSEHPECPMADDRGSKN